MLAGSLFLRMRKYDELVIKIYSARKREGKRVTTNHARSMYAPDHDANPRARGQTNEDKWHLGADVDRISRNILKSPD